MLPVNENNSYGTKKFKRKTVTSQVSTRVLIMSLIAFTGLGLFAYFFYWNTSVDVNSMRAASLATGFASAMERDRFQSAMERDTPNVYANLIQTRVEGLLADLDDGLVSVFVVSTYDQPRYFAYASRPHVPSRPGGTAFGTALTDAAWGSHAEYARTALRLGEIFTDVRPHDLHGMRLIIPAFAPIHGEYGELMGIVVTNFYMAAVWTETIIFAVLLTIAGYLVSILIWLAIRMSVSNALSYSLRRIVSADHTFDENSPTFKARTDDAMSKDEIATLYSNFGEVYHTFGMVIEDVRNLSEKHMSGYYKERIDESRYTGGHKELVKSVNTMVEMYVNDTIELLEVVQEYGKGNFNPSTNTYPGDWAWANEVMINLQDNFTNIAAQMSKLAEEFNKGNFNVTADAKGTQGEWYALIENLNQIAFTVRAPIGEIKDVMERLDAGNFDKKVEGNYAGDFAAITKSVNSCVVGLGQYVREIDASLSAMAGGDLTRRTTMAFDGEFNLIGQSINSIADALHKTMTEISAAATQVLSGANQVSESAMDLASGNEEQASSVQELNASIDMLVGQTKQNANNAADANALSVRSTDSARDGNDAMKKMLLAMDGIKDASGNISRIIKVIQDIAFQTNLLALNASVEAARAGEHGKGFSVVAEEVGTLAKRSQTAAVDTTSLIQDSINRVDAGSKIAGSTAASLDVIVDNATGVLHIINNIAASSKDQAEAIDKLTVGLNQISGVIQTNSSVSQETAAAAQELNSQAVLLRQLVAYFKL